MDKKLKAKWVKALRSGKYRKGKGRLKKRNGSYCCLGVLCDISGVPLDFNRAINSYEVHGNPNFLPKQLLKAFGLPAGAQQKLAQLNDGEDDLDKPIKARKFSEIADYIEKNL